MNTIKVAFEVASEMVTQQQWYALMGGDPPEHPDAVKTVTWEEAEECCRRHAAKTGEAWRLPFAHELDCAGVPPNGWWEWCADDASPGLRMVRGGSWSLDARWYRVAERYWLTADARRNRFGLRFARSRFARSLEAK